MVNTKQQIEHLQTVFLDVTDPKSDPVMLKSTALSFAPTFQVGDKINFLQIAPSDDAIQFNTQGQKPTHRIKSVHWTIINTDGEIPAMTCMVVNLEKITATKERVFEGFDNN